MASENESNTVDRRSFLAASAAGAVVVASAPKALAAAGKAESGLHAGMALGGGWALQSIGPVEAGAIRIVAAHAATSRVANVAVCRHEAGSGAIASTGLVDLFLMNDGGNGGRLTPDDEVQLVRALAERLAGAEETLPGAARLLGRTARLQAYDPIDHLEPVER